jgi:tRNA (Thr-GGU) A37 N-methylase
VHPVRIRAVDGTRIEVEPFEAVDVTPVLDIKPLLERDMTTGDSTVRVDVLAGASRDHGSAVAIPRNPTREAE